MNHFRILFRVRSLTSSFMKSCWGYKNTQRRKACYDPSIVSNHFGQLHAKRLCSSNQSSMETTRGTTYPKSFCEWLAGVIDGDGSLYLDRERYPRLSITMGSEDRPLLEYIRNELGSGGIDKVPQAKAYRYRLQNRLGIMKLIQIINGLIRNSVRLPQLMRVCKVLGIPMIEPLELTAQSNLFSGFFDADGTIGIHGLPKKAPQLKISITNNTGPTLRL